MKNLLKEIEQFLTKPLIIQRWKIVILLVLAMIPFVGQILIIVVLLLNLTIFYEQQHGGKINGKNKHSKN